MKSCTGTIWLACLLGAVVIASAPTTAWSQPAPISPELPHPTRGEGAGRSEDPVVRFEVAENTFRYQDYQRTVELLEALLYPEPLLEEAQELLAREYLGASYWWLKGFERAEDEFTSLLTRAPDRKLDSFYYPAALISFFEGVREKLVQLKIIKRDEPDPVGGGEGQAAVLRERVVHERSRLLCFFPFGVGQFQNGDTALGVTFLTLESLALITNIASYFLIDSLREDSGFIASQNMKRAEAFEISMYASLGVRPTVAVAGIVESLVSFEPRDEEIRILTPEPRPTEGAPELSRAPVPALRVGPSGLDFQLRF